MVRFIMLAAIPALVLIIGSISYAEVPACPDAAMIQSILSGNQLNNWNDIYQSKKKHAQCDSGALSEGYSYAVAKTLAHKWETISELRKLTASDKTFEQFVMTHINATADPRDIVKVLSNARERCPASDAQLCSAIEAAVRKALQELGAMKK